MAVAQNVTLADQNQLASASNIAHCVIQYARFQCHWILESLRADERFRARGRSACVRSMLMETGFGHAWLAGAATSLIVLILSLAQAGSPIRFKPAIWLAHASVAMSRSHAGHPVDAGGLRIPMWVDWLYLLAISVWVGLVLAATYVVLPRMFNVPVAERGNSAAFVQSLSDAATLALAILFVAGAHSGWRGVNTPESLLTSSYGQVLLVKVVLVLVAAGLGGYNRLFEMPRLVASFHGTPLDSGARPLTRFATVLRAESLILAGVLAGAAIYVSSPLPGTS